MTARPDGPIYIDLLPSFLEQLPMVTVAKIANLAMNRLSMRDWGEIFGEVDLRPTIAFVPVQPSDE